MRWHALMPSGNLTIHPVWDWSLVNFLVTCMSAGLGWRTKSCILRVMLWLFLDWCLFWKMKPGSNWILCLVRPCLVLWVTPKVLQRSPLQFQVLGRSLHRLLLLSSKKHQCQVPTVVLLRVCSVHYNIHLNAVGGFRKFFTKISFLMQNKLCFDCLGKDHLKSQCSKKIVCDVCKGPHNTLLHRPAGKTNVEGQVGVVSGGVSSTGKCWRSVGGDSWWCASPESFRFRIRECYRELLTCSSDKCWYQNNTLPWHNANFSSKTEADL